MELFLSAIGVFVCSAVLSISARPLRRLRPLIGAAGIEIGSLLGLWSIVSTAVLGARTSVRQEWTLPGASLYLGIDSLSALFLGILFLMSAAAALYAVGYLRQDAAKRNLSLHWSFFNVFVASMAVAIAARNAVLFLIAWEVMSISSFFLVSFEHEKFRVRRASFVYLVATNIGTAFLLMAFIVMGSGQTVLDYEKLHASGAAASIAFLCALAGFGLKAGVVPLHTWLPQAHPAAPSHVSALMSGVMIKMGIYGLLRTVEILGSGPAWWGVLLIGIGAVSGVLGVLFALGQHDLKRLLAYHSVENIGIIVLGIGIGLVGQRLHSPGIVALGYGGALLHVINHAIFKGLLFLGAGAVLHETATREIDALGGLIKRMPVTALCFLIGSAAISGLPPLNGFVSEFLIYSAAFQGAVQWRAAPAAASGSTLLLSGAAVIIALALIGGLALACFAKAFGVVFLGEPRSSHPKHAVEPPFTMLLPMVLLAFLCFAIGMLSAYALPFLALPVAVISQSDSMELRSALGTVSHSIALAAKLCSLFLLGCGFVAALRKVLLRKRSVRTALTWDCGYVRPASSMQYSSSSFAQPIVDFFSFVLFPSKRVPRLSSLFPGPAKFHSHVPDVFAEKLYHPVAAFVQRTVAKLREHQPTNVHFFAGYIIAMLILLVIWNYLQGAAS